MMLLVKNGSIMAMAADYQILADGALVIEGNRIIALGQTQELLAQYPQAQVLDAKGGLVVPGFINAHTHLYQVLYKGLGDDVALADWLNKCIWPLSLNLRGEDCYAATMLAAAEMLRCGTTTYVDSHYINQDTSCQDYIVQATAEIGIRGVLGRGSVDLAPVPEPLREDVEQAQRECARIIEAYQGAANGRITVRVEPLNETLCSEEMLLAMRDIARHYGVGFNMHVAETKARTEAFYARHGQTQIQYLAEREILGPQSLLAHCCWVNEQDIQLLAQTGACVAYNPISNQYLGDGVAPIPAMLRQGVVVTAGSDGAASNNNHDIFSVMKEAALLQKAHNMDAAIITAQDALAMLTVQAAKALGMEQEIGTLEVGKKADVVIMNASHPSMLPCFQAVSNLVYAAVSEAVDTVIVDGKIVMKERQIQTIDEQRTLHQANEAAQALARRSGLIR